ncbi:MAG: hypothetical protein LBT01_05520 [Spirochaetaceae bacterium]|jgi:branched-subunit amino acid ABC-type transport system permease component|nr:hypothetical protein [Spirochaetaceae bacterium]
MTNKITNFAVGSFMLITALTVFASCEVIASTQGQDLSFEAEWIQLKPTVAVREGEIWTASLALDFSKAVEGLVDTLDTAVLAELFTFEYQRSTVSGITATTVKKTAAGSYTLSVQNVSDNSAGIVLVTINKKGITPSPRIWALNGDVVIA